MNTKLVKATLAVVTLFVSGLANAGLITKSPDLGDFWQPLSNSGTYIYANSFVADESGSVTELGTWLNGGSSDLVFQVYSSIGGDSANGPDSQNVLATTDVISGLSFQTLTYVSFDTLAAGIDLIFGETYWFAASTVGLGGSGTFNVGGHTQNSEGIVDNGTFWYSNDPAGINFDGRGLTPEMAFTVRIEQSVSVPEPSSIAFLALGILGLVSRRAKK